MIRSIQNWNNQDKPIDVRVLEKKTNIVVGAFAAVVGW
jgi:hypothetical protein